jgi:DNA modification methylase
LPGGDYTCFIFGAYVQILVWYKLLEKWRKVNQILCWKKDNAVMSRLHFHMEFELIYHIYKYESEWNAPVGIGDVLYYPNVNSFGYMKDDGERNKNNDAQIHPHQKPLKLVQDLVMWGSGEAGKVYDPFSGSGTTTIAAENLARQCRACEISPAYVAVALERYFQAFNIKPELME